MVKIVVPPSDPGWGIAYNDNPRNFITEYFLSAHGVNRFIIIPVERRCGFCYTPTINLPQDEEVFTVCLTYLKNEIYDDMLFTDKIEHAQKMLSKLPYFKGDFCTQHCENEFRDLYT